MQGDSLVSHGHKAMVRVTPRRRPRHKIYGHIDLWSHGRNAMTSCCTKKRAWARHEAAIATRCMQEHGASNGCSLNV